MAIFDSLLSFVAIGGNLSLVGGAGVAIPSPNVIDLLGTGAGTAPKNIIGNATLFGEDAGEGEYKPRILVGIGTGLVSATSALLNIAVQAAPDAGTPTYQPGTWQTLVETGGLPLTILGANAQPIEIDWPPVLPPLSFRPRFYRMLFSPVLASGALSTGNFSAGTIAFASMTRVPDEPANRRTPRNYTLALS